MVETFTPSACGSPKVYRRVFLTVNCLWESANQVSIGFAMTLSSRNEAKFPEGLVQIARSDTRVVQERARPFRIDDSSGGRFPDVAMMKATDTRQRFQPSVMGPVFDIPSVRRVLVESDVGSILVVVTNIFACDSPHVSFVDGDHVVKTLPAGAAHPAFGDAVLPRTSNARTNWLDSGCLQHGKGLTVEFGVAIQDRVSISARVRECRAQLLANPTRGRVVGNIEVQNPAPVVVDDEETVQKTEGDCRHREEVHCSDGLTVIL